MASQPNDVDGLPELTRRVGELRKAGKLADAVPLAERLAQVVEAPGIPEVPEVADALIELAELLIAFDRSAEAELLLQRALGILVRQPGGEAALRERYSHIDTSSLVQAVTALRSLLTDVRRHEIRFSLDPAGAAPQRPLPDHPLEKGSPEEEEEEAQSAPSSTRPPGSQSAERTDEDRASPGRWEPDKSQPFPPPPPRPVLPPAAPGRDAMKGSEETKEEEGIREQHSRKQEEELRAAAVRSRANVDASARKDTKDVLLSPDEVLAQVLATKDQAYREALQLRLEQAATEQQRRLEIMKALIDNKKIEPHDFHEKFPDFVNDLLNAIPSPNDRHAKPDRSTPQGALDIEAGRLAYQIPERMWVGVQETVEVRLGAVIAKEIMQGFVGRGDVKLEHVPIVETMSVSLVCEPGTFDIDPRSEKDQLVKR